jgi:hypothetical protein
VKYIKIVSVQLKPSFGANMGIQTGAVAQDGTSNTTQWLSGSNQWGLHQDPRFGASMSTIRQSMRIMEAAEKAAATGAPYIELAPEDYAILLAVARQPEVHPNSPKCPVDLFRGCMPIFESIEAATDEKPE